jgi:hypothetical protein
MGSKKIREDDMSYLSKHIAGPVERLPQGTRRRSFIPTAPGESWDNGGCRWINFSQFQIEITEEIRQNDGVRLANIHIRFHERKTVAASGSMKLFWYYTIGTNEIKEAEFWPDTVTGLRSSHHYYGQIPGELLEKIESCRLFISEGLMPLRH